MASNADTKAMKSLPKTKDARPQTLTINFIPEAEICSKPENIEEYIRTYFEGINGINRRIIAEERKVIAQNRNTWPSLTVEERDELLNDRLIASDIRQKYNTNDEYWKERTPWQPERLNSSEDLETIREQRTDSMSLNDSFSKPFHWATKSQRNLKFPMIKQEKRKIKESKEQHQLGKDSSSKKCDEINKSKKEDETVKKINNVEQSIKEKQIKTKNENLEVDVCNTGNTKIIEDKLSTTSINESRNQPPEQESTSDQPKLNESEYMDGSKNIFEFLQSWNP